MVHIFLINPIAGNINYSQALREEIAELKGIKYYIFNIRYAGYETKLMRDLEELFEDEGKIRVYCCGGSGTIKHVLDGITDFNKVELAFYPAGMTNDFLKVFGDDLKKFRSVKNLVEGEAKWIDYIDTDHGRALNTFSTGLDASIVEGTIKGHELIPYATNSIYLLSMIYGIFFSKYGEYRIELDDEVISGALTEMMVGNGNILGGMLHISSDKNITDGQGVMSIIEKARRVGVFPFLKSYITGDVDFINSKCINRVVKEMTIISTNNSDLKMNMDGEIVTGMKECHMKIIKEGLQFVIPKGVELP